MNPTQNQTQNQAIDAFSRLEHAGWQKVVRAYQRSFGGLTIQTVEPLLDAVGAEPGLKLLDAAAGPGYVAAAAATRGAEVSGLDFSSSMVAAAQQQHPEVKFRHGNAESLPFESGSFDAVAINFGMLHFAQPDRALEEACRVLRTGGRVGFTVWSKPDNAVGFHIILDAIRTCGNINVALPEGPPFFRFSDARECSDALLKAGFADARVCEVAQLWRLPSGGALFDAFQTATVRTAALLNAQTHAALIKIRAAVEAAAKPYQRVTGEIELPMPAVLASATKI